MSPDLVAVDKPRSTSRTNVSSKSARVGAGPESNHAADARVSQQKWALIPAPSRGQEQSFRLIDGAAPPSRHRAKQLAIPFEARF
jgi:hypothetical protein